MKFRPHARILSAVMNHVQACIRACATPRFEFSSISLSQQRKNLALHKLASTGRSYPTAGPCFASLSESWLPELCRGAVRVSCRVCTEHGLDRLQSCAWFLCDSRPIAAQLTPFWVSRVFSWEFLQPSTPPSLSVTSKPTQCFFFDFGPLLHTDLGKLKKEQAECRHVKADARKVQGFQTTQSMVADWTYEGLAADWVAKRGYTETTESGSTRQATKLRCLN